MQTNQPTATTEQDLNIQESLESTRRYVRSYQALLKQQAVWLLLATLGCWSVTSKPLQWIAYVLVLLIFIDRMSEKTKDQASFSKTFATLNARILQDIPAGDTQKARLWDLKELQRTELGPKVNLQRNFLFFACWMYFGFSFLASTPLFYLH